jgi:hypothetical protein
MRLYSLLGLRGDGAKQVWCGSFVIPTDSFQLSLWSSRNRQIEINPNQNGQEQKELRNSTR